MTSSLSLNLWRVLRFWAISHITFLLFNPPALGYRFDLTPSVSFSEEYSDNLFLSKEDKQDGFTTVMTPGFSSRLLWKYGTAALSYQLGFVDYSRFRDSNTFRHQAGLIANVQVSKTTTFNFQNSFQRTELPISETDSTVRKGRYPYHSYSAGLNLAHQFGKFSSLTLNGNWAITKNESPDTQDHTSKGVSIAVNSLLLPPYLGFDAQVSYNNGEFSGSSEGIDQWGMLVGLSTPFNRQTSAFIRYSQNFTDYQEFKEDYQVHNLSVGAIHSVDRHLNLNLSVGYFWNDQLRRQAGLSGSLGLSRALKKGDISVSGTTGYRESFFGAENLGFEKYTQIGCGGSYHIAKWIAVSASGYFRHDHYIGEIDRTDQTFGAATGISFQVTKKLAPKVNYSFRRLNSTDTDKEYEENRISFTINWVHN